jgi:hypothetical protein
MATPPDREGFVLFCLPVLLFGICVPFHFFFRFIMHFSSFLAAIAVAIVGTNAQTQYTATNAASVAAARATAMTLSPTSSVKGKTFDRFVNIFLENTDFDMAAADRKTSLPALLC